MGDVLGVCRDGLAGGRGGDAAFEGEGDYRNAKKAGGGKGGEGQEGNAMGLTQPLC